MLIGREQEQQTLLNLLKSDESEFCAVYGRRRVGKTYLIRESFNYSFTFSHTGVAKAGINRQLSAFRDSLQSFSGNKLHLPKDWFDAFIMLEEYVKACPSGKKIIFIDELSWMDTPKSGFVSALEHFWNGWATARAEHDIVLIVCASSASWITKKIFHNRGGLYNRLTERIHLNPLTLAECEKLAVASGFNMSRKDIAEAYMILGGIPFYWSLMRRDLSLAQNIDNLFFSSNAKLCDEFTELYSSLFKNPKPYINIVRLLGKKKSGCTRREIEQGLKTGSSGTLTSQLEDLERSGFIRSYRNLVKSERDTIFQLIDNYTLFYFAFLEKGNSENKWSVSTMSSEHNSWAGLAFERLCLWHTTQIKKALSVNGISAEFYSWFYKPTDEEKSYGIKGVQIDMLIDRADNVINLCEMKFSNGEYTIDADTESNIRHKMSMLIQKAKTKKSIHPILITTYGLTKNIHSNIMLHVVTLDDLFAE